jgi:DNA-binding HxlR family transcriptional regulator
VAKHNLLKKHSRSQASPESTDLQRVRPELRKALENSGEKLDRLIHERLRLGIVSALAANESLTFSELKKLMSTSDGNLSVHARKLEEAQYIVCTKSFVGRVPQTEYRLTASGRKALEKYLAHMEALIKATREEMKRE